MLTPNRAPATMRSIWRGLALEVRRLIVFSDLTSVAHAFQLVVVEQKGVRKLQPRKTDRFGAAEHPQEHLTVCGKIRQRFAVDTAAAGKQRAELALQAAARHDGQPGERVTDDRTIHGADGRKRRRTADVKPCADNKVTLDQNFAGHDAFSSPVLDSE